MAEGPSDVAAAGAVLSGAAAIKMLEGWLPQCKTIEDRRRIEVILDSYRARVEQEAADRAMTYQEDEPPPRAKPVAHL